MRWRALLLLLLIAGAASAAVAAQVPVASRHDASALASTWSEVDDAARTAVAAGDVPGAVVLVGEGDTVL